jgi:cytochrome b561
VRLRNGAHGYGVVTKTLHWLTVLAFAGQFYVGYTMDTDVADREVGCDPAAEDRSGGDTSDALERRLDREEESCEAALDREDDAVGAAWSDLTGGGVLGDGLSAPELHVLLGLTIIGLAVLRSMWRATTPLPPWDPRLTPTDQRVVHATEVVLLTLQYVVPATGIYLVAVDDGALRLHVLGHIAFFVALAAHLAMVLGRGLLPRMLPGR